MKPGMGYLVDVHCHILPAVDDGSQSMEETMQMLRIAAEEGITAMIATPHYKEGRHNASRDTIYDCLARVQAAAVAEGIPVKLYPGNEIYSFSEIGDALENKKVLSLNDTRRVLIEFSPMEDFTYIRNAADKVRGFGYIPVIAHVERYSCMVRQPEHVEELKDMGAEIQINAASITGALGHSVKRFARRILDEALVDYVGTDAHDTKKRAPGAQDCLKLLYKRYDSEYVDEITHGNAQQRLNAGLP